MLADAQRNNEKTDTKLIFHVRMRNEAAVFVAKDENCTLQQLERFLPPWYMKTDFNQVININMIYSTLGS